VIAQRREHSAKEAIERSKCIQKLFMFGNPRLGGARRHENPDPFQALEREPRRKHSLYVAPPVVSDCEFTSPQARRHIAAPEPAKRIARLPSKRFDDDFERAAGSKQYQKQWCSRLEHLRQLTGKIAQVTDAVQSRKN
jgi:hypothetical protein